MLRDLGNLAQRRYEEGYEKGYEGGKRIALRRVAMIILMYCLEANTETWETHLASLDAKQLESFIQRALQASSLDDLQQ